MDGWMDGADVEIRMLVTTIVTRQKSRAVIEVLS